MADSGAEGLKTLAEAGVVQSEGRPPPVIDINALSLTFMTNDGPVEAGGGLRGAFGKSAP